MSFADDCSQKSNKNMQNCDLERNTPKNTENLDFETAMASQNPLKTPTKSNKIQHKFDVK